MMTSHFKKLRHLDLFSGIGGFSLGLEATGGFETVAFCDIEEYPRKVLEKHWPHVKQYTDIKELTYDKLKSDGLVSNTEKIDIITGGYPCQPFSVAGRKKGEEDPRHLWPEYFRLVQELQPTWVIGENVSGHIKLGLDTVLKNLESEGYSARTFSISASSVGANHQRERVWIIAHSSKFGCGSRSDNWEWRQVSNNEERQFTQDQSKQQRWESGSRKESNTRSITESRTNQRNEFRWQDLSGSKNMEDTRRSLRQRTFIRGENEKETGQGNADLTQRSGEASEFDVANTDSSTKTERRKCETIEKTSFEGQYDKRRSDKDVG